MLDTVKLTNRQKHYFLYILSSGKSLKGCAKDLGIGATRLYRMIARVDKKVIGFRERLNKLRRVTKGKGRKQPREIPWGDMSCVPHEENHYMLYGKPHKTKDFSEPEEPNAI